MNCETLESLIRETNALATTLKEIAETINRGLEEFQGLPESSGVHRKVVGSIKLLERVEKLAR